MASGATTSAALVEAYLDRIATLDPLVNAVRCLTPDAAGAGGARWTRSGARAGCADRCTAYPSSSRTTSTSPACRRPRAALGARALGARTVTPASSVRLREAGAVVHRQDQPDRDGQLHGREHAERVLLAGRPGAQPVRRQLRRRAAPAAGSGPRRRSVSRRSPSAPRPTGRSSRPRRTRAWSASSPRLGLVPGDGILPIATQPGLRRADVPHRRRRARRCSGCWPARRTARGPLYPPETLRGVRLALPPEPDDLHAQEARGLPRRAGRAARPRRRMLVEVPALPETDELPVLLHEFARDLDAYLAELPEGAPIRSDA